MTTDQPFFVALRLFTATMRHADAQGEKIKPKMSSKVHLANLSVNGYGTMVAFNGR
jgi:hypothetical protein